jgi:hypothetical protein
MTKDSNQIDIPDQGIPYLGDVLKQLKLSFAAGLIIILIFALQSSSRPQFISVVGVGFLIALAFFFFGIFIGFIFGIPRIMSEPCPPAVSSPNDLTAQQESSQIGPYGENTNFDQVSDWLTKILVGIGLVQLTLVPAALQQYSNNVAPALGNFSNNSSGPFGVAILIFFSVDGFFVGYLWTRRRLMTEFGRGRSEFKQVWEEKVDEIRDKVSKVEDEIRDKVFKVDEIQDKLSKVDDKLSEVDERTRNDSEAIKLVTRVLNPPLGYPPVNQQELQEKIQKASYNARAKIFYDAAEIRSKNWRENKPIMERTIPIFHALIANDTENKYHNNHGQLGFALKDKRQPDYAEADKELTKAIEIRGAWKSEDDINRLYYELNRAICRIHLDEGFNNDKPTAVEKRELILKDISSADNNPDLSRLMMSEEKTPIPKWMKLNNLNIQDYVHLR